MSSFFQHIFSEFKLPLHNDVLIFSILLLIIFIAPILLRKLKIPSLIVLIIAGVAIGPKGLNIIGEKYVESGGALKLFSIIGLLYIMFIAGLELDLEKFKQYKNKSLIFGILTFSIPLFLGYFVCLNLLELSHTASWLTASMFATHTLISYPIINKYGLNNLQAVAITVGGTILTDTAVLILLAILSKSNGQIADLNSFIIGLVTSLLLFSAIMYFVIPRIAKWFLAKLEYEKSSQYIFVFALVFFSSFLAEMAGVEPIIGAFFSGLVLNRIIPLNSRLRHQIEFVGNALFIPFFLISVGMLIDVRIIFNNFDTLFIALVLTSFAIFSKWIAAVMMQIVFKMHKTDRKLIFGLSTSHAAATLAVIMVGYESGILNINIVNGTIVLILITCLVSTLTVENASLKAKIKLDKEQYHQLIFKNTRKYLVYLNEENDDVNLINFAQLLYGSAKSKILNTLHIQAENLDKDESTKHSKILRTHVFRSDVEVNKIETVDRNISSGIGQMAIETQSDLIILNDYKHQNILRMVIGDDRFHLLQSCKKTILFCNLQNNISSYEKLILHCPKYSDLEKDFINNINIFINLALELKTTITLYSTEVIQNKIQRIIESRQLLLPILFIPESEEIFLNLEIKQENLFIEFRFRNNTLSKSNIGFTNMHRIENELKNMDYIFLYPAEEDNENLTSFEKL